MTETTKTILEKYQVRKTKKQKTAFIEYIESIARELGYECNVEKGVFGSRNIVIGDPDSAKVLYTAHYDTCARLPFPNLITPKNIGVFVLFQVAVTLMILIPLFLFGVILGVTLAQFDLDPTASDAIFKVCLYAFLLIFMFLVLDGPANKHTANDNTSGVTTLLDVMHELPLESRGNVAFIFFDLEEQGLFGSSAFRSKHKKGTNGKLVLNFDCVSEGKNMLFAVKRKAKKFVPLLEKSFKSDGSFNIDIATKGFIYPSDQANFPCGVGVAALNKTKKLNILYLGKIHTKHDTVYQEENIRFLVDGAVKLASIIE